MGMFSKITGQSSEAERAENGDTIASPRDTAGPSADHDRDIDRDTARRGSTSSGQQHRLPAGTGPGTSGKPTSESAMEYDRERAYEHNTIAGHGTDSAAAHGGSIADTHRERNQRSSGGQMAPLASREGNIERDTSIRGGDMARAKVNRVLKENHERGHLKPSDPNLMPSDDKEEKTDQLNPVVHEVVYPVEHQEVQRIKNIERHIHHIQHHIQPVIAKEIMNESLRDVQHPETTVQEFHGSLPADNTLFETQMREPKNMTTHHPKEYVTLEKGTVIHENVHHHIHHVIQPVIQQRIVERETIRSTIPVREIRHEAPIIHQTESHNPVTMEHFRDHNGILANALSVENIGDMLLHRSPCSRTAEGPEGDAERELQVTDRTLTDVGAGGATTTTTTTTSGRRGSRLQGETTGVSSQDYGGQHGRNIGTEANVPTTIAMT